MQIPYGKAEFIVIPGYISVINIRSEKVQPHSGLLIKNQTLNHGFSPVAIIIKSLTPFGVRKFTISSYYSEWFLKI